jgi:hypothetical protein
MEIRFRAALLVLGGFLVVPGDCFAFTPGSFQHASFIQSRQIHHGGFTSPLALRKAAPVHPRIQSKKRATVTGTKMMMDPASLSIGMHHEKNPEKAGGATAPDN